MNTLPAYMLDLVAPEHKQHKKLSQMGRRVGARVELDLERIKELDPALVDGLVAYAERCTEFWDRYAAGSPAGECVVIQRRIHRSVKVDTKTARAYLKDEIEALEDLTGFGPVVTELLGSEPDLEALARRGVKLTTTGTTTTATFRVAGRLAWEPLLGGAHSRGEVARVFELRISHAKSHDRRNQRLLSLEVRAEEIWPKP